MTIPLPGRAAVLGLVALVVPAGTARGNDFFRSHCSPKGCDTQRVVIPGQQVEVVRETPRVVVREVAPAREVVHRSIHHRDAGVVPIGTVYMPFSIPTMPVFPGVAPASREICPDRDREIDSHPFEAIHRAEIAAYKSDRALREVQAMADMHQRAASRMLPSGAGANRGVDATRGPDTAAIETRLKALEEGLGKLNERVTSVEKLLIYHDNYITQQAGRPGGAPPMVPPAGLTIPPVPLAVPPPPGIGGSTTPPMLPPPGK